MGASGCRFTSRLFISKCRRATLRLSKNCPGPNTQGTTLEEKRENLVEVLELVLEANRQLSRERLAGLDVIREPFSLA